MSTATMESAQKVVSRDQWLAARTALLAKEKALTRQRDALARERQQLPWVRLEKDYTFDTPQGRKTLADLFNGRTQLAVYHFMLGPGWPEGCPSCSMVADGFDATAIHLAQRDVQLTAVSRAPLPEIQAFKRRMGWHFPWASSFGTDFNRDFGVLFTPAERQAGARYNYGSMENFPKEDAPGLSIFTRGADGAVYHTYSTYGRGLDPLLDVYTFLDLTPKGRDEANLPWPMAWVRHHDKYESQPVTPGTKSSSCGCGSHAESAS